MATYIPRGHKIEATRFDGSAESAAEVSKILPAGITVSWPPMGDTESCLVIRTPGRYDRVVLPGMWVGVTGGLVITHSAQAFDAVYQEA